MRLWGNLIRMIKALIKAMFRIENHVNIFPTFMPEERERLEGIYLANKYRRPK